ncbi:hypothetical protein METBIDRAFT_137100 [Metschnikowia bicuspidata var. bicuspidata NRRL YB-4993]|uniref:Hyphally-regulated cell wall protein N-terminal domain-containing protein n=1 Tax=Metschnikowia bicuspidata var. bicuspidata NRRL YB-4993 TaxID=869754 RepID=A0A1A0GYX9_9ASCO|nr:hypothetical protein METBIDRAFT_137100 [Metschnikowia bicuspidata var. bicuspidata NRRL YB-4993]OBA16979.1 hypothetical protein METBIDRAFT_137100 [Metschnikowia bicuspidata var. bicuspidata NRRL YB-4993]
MYFGVHNAIFDSLSFSVTSLSSWSNTGMMVFISKYGELQLQCYEENGIQTFITNNGTIFFANIHWEARTNIKGDGCMILGSGVLVNLHLSESTQGIAKTQTIYLAFGSSRLRIIGIESHVVTYLLSKSQGLVMGINNQSKLMDPLTGFVIPGDLACNSVEMIIFNIVTGYYGSFGVENGFISFSEQPLNNHPTFCERTIIFPSGP